MAVQRRYLLPSSLARLLQREGGPANRLIEAHFPARSDRTQLVRVERGQAALILRSNAPDGQVGEEAVEVPLSHAEALVEVAAGTVAFDRTAVSLGRGMEGVLDRYILPEGLDLLSVTITGDIRLFAPPLWLGREVTSEEAFEARELAINGLPVVEEVEVTNAALEALLDTLEMRGLRPSRAPDPRRASRMPAPPTAPPAATPVLDTSVRPAPQVSFNPQQHTSPLAAETGNDEGEAPFASAEPHEGAGLPGALDAPPAVILDGDSEDDSIAGSGVEAAIEQLFAPTSEETSTTEAKVSVQHDAPSLPDVQDGPALGEPQPAPSRRPVLRTNIRELDDGIARLARSLSPRGSRSNH